MSDADSKKKRPDGAPQRYPDVDAFEDPLQNYEPKTYNDALERALAEETVEAMHIRPYASISPTATVAEAVQQLAQMQVACLLVEEDGALLGVLTDRNILDKVALEFNEVKDHPLTEVMTANPVHVNELDAAGAALSVMAVSGYRHVPVLDRSDRVTGIVSPQRVAEFLQENFNRSKP